VSHGRISSDLRAFLDTVFPGSTIDDGYFFVRIEAPVAQLVHRDRFQPIADRLGEGDGWLVVVDADPRGVVPGADSEERTVHYRPDWDVDEKRSQWVVVLHDTRVPLAPLIARLAPGSALAIVNAGKRVVLDVGTARVYATSLDDLHRFFDGIEDSIDRWPGA
jgi:hypothetical protein